MGPWNLDRRESKRPADAIRDQTDKVPRVNERKKVGIERAYTFFPCSTWTPIARSACMHADWWGSIDNIKLKPSNSTKSQSSLARYIRKKKRKETGMLNGYPQATAGAKPNSIKTRCRCSSPSQKRGNASRDMWGHGRPR